MFARSVRRDAPPTTASARHAATFAVATGVVGTAANVALVGFFAFQAGRPERGVSLGSTNDLLGSAGTALMIPVALALSRQLPRRRGVEFTQAVGIASMIVLTAAGPLLVLGVLAFTVSTAISLSAYLLLAAWLLLMNRWLYRSGALGRRITRLGELLGLVTVAAGAMAALSLLLPAGSWPRLALITTAAVVAAVGVFGVPIWFLLLGRHLAGTHGSGSPEPATPALASGQPRRGAGPTSRAGRRA